MIFHDFPQKICFKIYLIREQGIGNREQGIGNREQGIGNRE